jgi:hypothetical protein
MLLQVAPSPSITAVLPEALTAQILQHVPQQQRLQQCALVCKAWASAAAVATVHVEQKYKPAQTIPAIGSWLRQHAAQLESLQLSYRGRQRQPQLPWAKLAKLQRLQLWGFALSLPGERDSSGSGSSGEDTRSPAPLLLPSLQHLELVGVELISVSSLLQLAASAPGLTSLKIDHISFAQVQFDSGALNPFTDGIDKAGVQQVAAAMPRLLQQLLRLAVLELPGIPMSAAAMQQLGCMQGLQEVSLEQVHHTPMYELQHLPSSITQLHFRGFMYMPEDYRNPSMPPQLQQLAGLLRLKLHGCAVPPTVLGAFTRLQALKLQGCTLLPAPADDDDLETEGTAALLDALAGMTCLQDLCLALQGLDTVSTAPQRFAALTASTQLTRLDVQPADRLPLAKGAAQYMFPAGRQLPLLEVLTLSPEVTGPDTGAENEWCIDGAELHNIATCCPGLVWLDISNAVRPGGVVCTDSSLAALLALPSCAEHILYLLSCTVLHCPALCCEALQCTALNCTELYCGTLHVTVLYGTTFYVVAKYLQAYNS